MQYILLNKYEQFNAFNQTLTVFHCWCCWWHSLYCLFLKQNYSPNYFMKCYNRYFEMNETVKTWCIFSPAKSGTQKDLRYLSLGLLSTEGASNGYAYSGWISGTQKNLIGDDGAFTLYQLKETTYDRGWGEGNVRVGGFSTLSNLPNVYWRNWNFYYTNLQETLSPKINNKNCKLCEIVG